MAESTNGEAGSTDGARCPWCSAELPPGVENCPSCKANLTSGADQAIPGLTAVDIDTLTRKTTQKRNRPVSWISGEVDDEPPPPEAGPGSLEPPPLEVRREMLRLEMAALAADLTAEAGSLAADEAIEAIERGDEAEARADIRAEIDAVEATEALVEADDVGSSASSPAESGGAAT